MNNLDLKFIELAKERHPESFKGVKVLEVGALDVNGNVRGPFIDCEFLGVDWIEGKNVDVVMRGKDTKLPKEKFDVLLSANHLEHDPEWEETLAAVLAALKPGGLILLRWATRRSSAHGPEFDPHGKQGYYPKDVPEICEFLQKQKIGVLLEYADTNPCIGVMGNVIARKPA